MVFKANGQIFADSNGQNVSNVTVASGAFSIKSLYQDAFLGTTAGYVVGGFASPGSASTSLIQTFPFATDTNSRSAGDILTNVIAAAGNRSRTHGYVSLGNSIEKFPFSVTTSASDVGDLASTMPGAQQGVSSLTHGYIAGGANAPGVAQNIIERFPFAVDGNASDVGDLAIAVQTAGTHASDVNGYVSGGTDASSTRVNSIQKFPFVSSTNSSDVADLTSSVGTVGGVSSLTHGYVSGGNRISPPPAVPPTPIITNNIEKFPFATDANSSDVGDLNTGRTGATGVSGSTHGYSVSGQAQILPAFTTPVQVNSIDKFSISSDQNATDVGDLTSNRHLLAPTQH